jgi:hypothetical protein
LTSESSRHGTALNLAGDHTVPAASPNGEDGAPPLSFGKSLALLFIFMPFMQTEYGNLL